MIKLLEIDDPVREALVYAEGARLEWLSWSHGEALRRLRIRLGLKRYQVAARAGVSASLVGRAEKGADVRLSTLRRLYAALDCRLVLLPSGVLYHMDWDDAHRDNAYIDWKLEGERLRQLRGLTGNANSSTIGG